jgi:GNAT superfamily N-acetyltransferase
MKRTKTRFTARTARPADFRSIVRLCRRAVGPRDYVLSFLRDAIAEKSLFLALKGDELVGMTNFEKCIDGSGWLSMARTDPAWRRTGVAVFLQKRIAAFAKRRGITALRLWTSAKNKPSLSAIGKGGFRLVCEAAQISCSLSTKVKRPVIRPLTRLSSAQFESLLNSRYLTQEDGYMAYKWHFVKARKTLPKLLHRRELYSYGESTFILARTERVLGRVGFSATLLNGPMTASLRNSKETARTLGAHVIRAYVPYDRYLLKAARELGFRIAPWGQHCLVFERNIP